MAQGQERRGPRGGKLTPARARRLCDFIRTGAGHRAAARAAGIDPSTYKRWIDRGERNLAELAAFRAAGLPDELTPVERAYAKLVEQVAEAEAQFEVAAAGMMMQAARGGALVEERTVRRRDGTTLHTVRRAPPDWRAALALLRARRPDDWSERTQLEVSGAHGAPVLGGDQARERLLEMIARLRGSNEYPPHDRNGGRGMPSRLDGGPTTTEES
jgi:hypothetical protein